MSFQKRPVQVAPVHGGHDDIRQKEINAGCMPARNLQSLGGRRGGKNGKSLTAKNKSAEPQNISLILNNKNNLAPIF